MIEGILGEIAYGAELIRMGIDPEIARHAARQATLWRAARAAGIHAASVDNLISVDFVSRRKV